MGLSAKKSRLLFELPETTPQTLFQNQTTKDTVTFASTRKLQRKKRPVKAMVKRSQVTSKAPYSLHIGGLTAGSMVRFRQNIDCCDFLINPKVKKRQ